MPILQNERQERFCQALVQGKSKIDAYVIAGYSASRPNASTLAGQQHIKRRVAELSGQAAEIAINVAGINTGLTKTWVLEKLQENALKALKQKHGSSVANRALELIGKELGLFIERVEQGKPGDFSHLSDDELDAQISARLKAKGLNDRQVRNFLLTTHPVERNDSRDDEEARASLPPRGQYDA